MAENSVNKYEIFLNSCLNKSIRDLSQEYDTTNNIKLFNGTTLIETANSIAYTFLNQLIGDNHKNFDLPISELISPKKLAEIKSDLLNLLLKCEEIGHFRNKLFNSFKSNTDLFTIDIYFGAIIDELNVKEIDQVCSLIDNSAHGIDKSLVYSLIKSAKSYYDKFGVNLNNILEALLNNLNSPQPPLENSAPKHER